jgi:hypothetical protein
MRKVTQQRLYNLWVDIRNRCRNPRNKAYKYYGGRGITVDPRWNSFDAFASDVGPHPGNGLTLDRIRNNEGYRPGNTRWVTRKIQGQNHNYYKLTQVKADMLRAQWAAGAAIAALAQQYKIGETTVRRVLGGEA